jgi:UDP-N-acetylglucosamine 2-epimerase (non-hydrolysing)
MISRTALPDSQRRQRIVTVLGTRPEIIKCSPVVTALDDVADHTLVHTGQHYDDAMDGQFFRELALRPPDHELRVGSGAHGAQVARMLLGIEPILQRLQPDWVLVQGDTNSTLAGALAAAKLGLPIAHLEAGCRSFNRAMPEEINRVVVDHLAERCLAPDDDAVRNLRAEGIADDRIVLVGSTGIDACLRAATFAPAITDLGNATADGYLLVTIHRAENTVPERLGELLGALADLSARWPIVFPVHPRTAQAMRALTAPPGITYVEPVGYARMIGLLRGCRGLLTDSGGLQEEAAALGTPTFILRNETEWQAFVDAGQHRLVGTARDVIVRAVYDGLDGAVNEARMRRPSGGERAGAAGRVLAALGLATEASSAPNQLVAELSMARAD